MPNLTTVRLSLPSLIVTVLLFSHLPGAARKLEVGIPMRGGVQLTTTIFLPAAEGRYPVALYRTAYNKEGWLVDHEKWTKHGYVFIGQDVRGRYASAGGWNPFFQEKEDGYDTLDWIQRQPWCDGNIGMMGPSYLAGVQYLAVLGGAGGKLKSLIPTFMTGDLWKRVYYTDGLFSLFLTFDWACLVVGGRTSNRPADLNLNNLYRQLPLVTLDEKAGAGVVEHWREFLKHNTHDDFWKALSIHGHYDRFTMPVLQIGGCYDYYPREAFLNYQGMVDHAATPKLARSHKVLMGPWGHHHGLSRKAGRGNINFGHSDLDFGPESSLDHMEFYRDWFDRTLKPGGVPPSEGAPIRLFVMGANQWRDEYEWPLARTRYVNYYLHGGGEANTLNGDGRLTADQPGHEPADHYTYDPANPVPTRGGNHSIGPWNDSYEHLIWAGPSDQRPTEIRGDVLVYTTPPLEKDTEITGPVMLRLYAASAAPDTDFVGRLVDVYPDGRAINITEGVLRARFREKDWERPKLIEPGVVYEYSIDLQVTSNVFKKGHRIRLDITSSNFPLWDRNLNSGGDPFSGTEIRTAEQTIHHDLEDPSHLILPVIP